MRIITFKRIQSFILKYSDADIALRDWYFKAKKSEWGNIVDVRNTFRTADYIGSNRFVFNIKGNNFRLCAIVIFPSKKIYIRFIGTHSEYDKVDYKTI